MKRESLRALLGAAILGAALVAPTGAMASDPQSQPRPQAGTALHTLDSIIVEQVVLASLGVLVLGLAGGVLLGAVISSRSERAGPRSAR